MSLRLRIAAVLLAAVAFAAWRSQLFIVSRPGVPKPLAVSVAGDRRAADFDVLLPAVPVGVERLSSGGGRVLVIHYWAPWERHAAVQASALDSLRRIEPFRELRVIVVCFDPFPSLTRYVARQRLRLPVVLDGRGQLRRSLPCPSIPYTYVLDASGRIAVAQPGEVDWLCSATRDALAGLLAEPAPAPASAGTTGT